MRAAEDSSMACNLGGLCPAVMMMISIGDDTFSATSSRVARHQPAVQDVLLRTNVCGKRDADFVGSNTRSVTWQSCGLTTVTYHIFIIIMKRDTLIKSNRDNMYLSESLKLRVWTF